jgi:hypothetical protein
MSVLLPFNLSDYDSICFWKDLLLEALLPSTSIAFVGVVIILNELYVFFVNTKRSWCQPQVACLRFIFCPLCQNPDSFHLIHLC